MASPALLLLALLPSPCPGCWNGGGVPSPAPTCGFRLSPAGEKGEAGVRGSAGRSGKEGPPGARGLQKGQVGPPGAPCQRALRGLLPWAGARACTAPTASRRCPFDTELVNLDGAFDLAAGRFRCTVPGVYFLSLNVHTWNYKETYLHIMLNRRPAAVLYAQPSERSVMQAQSLMLPLAADDAVWVRMFQRDQDNAIYGEHGDLYITFSGHLVKPAAEL
uniref:C1q domain-containing protein n=1 Tax=Nomascus leucogenys TaxID=61853 RepID=A0A2I3HEQ1_NOMLE